jgi:hypothetical protein
MADFVLPRPTQSLLAEGDLCILAQTTAHSRQRSEVVGLCSCTAEVLAGIQSSDAIEGAQKGAEMSLVGQRIDGAMATFGTDLPLTSDLAICRKARFGCSGRQFLGQAAFARRETAVKMRAGLLTRILTEAMFRLVDLFGESGVRSGVSY